MARQKHLTDYAERLQGEMCGVSGFYEHETVIKVGGKYEVSKSDGRKQINWQHVTATLTIDMGRGIAEWDTPMNRCETPLPAAPFWLVYCNGVEGASVDVLKPKQYQELKKTTLGEFAERKGIKGDKDTFLW